MKLEFDLKIQSDSDGIVMYCTEREDGYGDFASFSIKEGFLEFRFDTGSGK